MTTARHNRLRIVPASVLLAVGLVILVLSGLGRFRAMALFPWIVGPVVAAVAVLDLVRRRRTATALERSFLAGALIAGLLAPPAQTVYLGIQRGRSERTAMARLAGQPAPALAADFSLNSTADSGPEPRAGRLTVVNFWATWCPPCVDELPMLDAWARAQDPTEVRIVGFTRLYGSREDEAAVQAELDAIGGFLRDHGVGHLNLVERGRATHDAYGVASMPSTVLVGPDGKLLDFGIGRPGARRVLATAEKLLRR